MTSLSSTTGKAILFSLLGAGLATLFALPVVFAQTFDDPACDPKLDPALCNKPTPIFSVLNPVSGQIIKTPLQVGEAAIPQSLTLRGGLILGQASMGITRASLAGIGVDVQSSDNYAISGQSSGPAGIGAIQGNGTGNARGVVATSQNADALYSFASGSGRAAFLEGGVQIGSTVAGGKAGNLTVGSSAVAGSILLSKGNLTLSNGNLSVNGTLTVNGQPVASGDLRTVVLNTRLNNGATQVFTPTNIIGYPASGSTGTYRPVSMQAIYNNATVPSRTWRPIFTVNSFTYTECTGTNFVGSLAFVNSTGLTADIKVSFTYRLEPVDCNQTDTTPPTVTLSSPANGINVSGSVNVTGTATDNVGGSGLKDVELLIDGSSTSPATKGTTSPYALSWDTLLYPDGNHSVATRATDNAGNVTTTPPITVNVTNGSGIACGSLICGGATPKCCQTCLDKCVAAAEACPDPC